MSTYSMHELETMVNAYAYCSLWASTNVSEDGTENYNLDERYSIEDFASEAKYRMERECKQFLVLAHAFELVNEDSDFEAVGYDFWLNRNGHGSGFWDKPEIYGKENCKKLDVIAESFGYCDVEEGDDGKLYFL